MNLEDRIKSVIRDVPDFPKKGIIFKDISTIMLDPVLSADIIDHLVDMYKDLGIEAVAALKVEVSYLVIH